MRHAAPVALAIGAVCCHNLVMDLPTVTYSFTVVVKPGYLKGEWTPTHSTNSISAAIEWANALFDRGASHAAVRDNHTGELIYHA